MMPPDKNKPAKPSDDARIYRYEITACEGRFAEMVEVGDVLVEDHYRGKSTQWELLDLSTAERTGWATGKYVGKREQVSA